MKVKSKIATDIKSLILAKAHAYTRNEVKSESSSEDDDAEIAAILRKSTEADKERKREKRRLKKQKKRDARAKSVKKDDEVAKTDAIAYLRLWNDSRDSWSFKKKLQCWLLNNAFNAENIPADDFDILLNYIMDLKGAAKIRLNEESEKMIKAHEAKAEESISDADIAIFERARSILQHLL